MTDKKITSNGVDVSKCNYFKAWYDSRPNGFGGITVKNYCYLYKDNCEKYPQCLYRGNQLQQLETQLKCKEQECDKYKEALDEIRRYRVCEINDEDGEEGDVILGIIDETKEQNDGQTNIL